MNYEIKFTAEALSDYNNCLNYLILEFKNLQAYNTIEKDFEETLSILETNALSFSLIENKDFRKKEYRKIHLKHHNYKIIYKVIKNEVLILAIFHDLQDYENILS